MPILLIEIDTINYGTFGFLSRFNDHFIKSVFADRPTFRRYLTVFCKFWHLQHVKNNDTERYLWWRRDHIFGIKTIFVML